MSHRLLYAVLKIGKALVITEVAYAPTNDDKHREETLDFYEQRMTTARMLKRKYPNAKLVGLGDLNARIGSVAWQSIGPYRCETDNGNGAQLRMFNGELDLCALNSFFQEADSATWCSKRGTDARIDYITVKREQLPPSQHMLCQQGDPAHDH